MSLTSRQCVLFLAHRWSPSIAAHYERLKRQAGPVLDVYLVLQLPRKDAPLPAGASPDIIVDVSDIRATFPLRFAEHDNLASVFLRCTETIWMTACLDPLLAVYAQFWVLEYDVDFSGDWGDFFGPAASYQGDLLGVDMRHLSGQPHWPNIKSFRQPADAVPDPLIGFFPIVRISRRLLETYHRVVAEPGWQGHFEVVVPTLAVANGFEVREIGGDGQLTPSERHHLHYTAAQRGQGQRSTFAFRPPVAYRYFCEAPKHFHRPNMLYHPVKPDMSLAARLGFAYRTHVGQPWVKFRNRLLDRG